MLGQVILQERDRKVAEVVLPDRPPGGCQQRLKGSGPLSVMRWRMATTSATMAERYLVCRTRVRSNEKPALPYVWSFNILMRLTLPSTTPELYG